MKKITITIVLLFAATLTRAQSDEAVQLLLNVEKLAQFKQILSDLKKGYQIVSKGYSTIKDLSQGNFNLHEAFLDGLLQVSPAVKKYRRVADIIRIQIELARDCKKATKMIRSSGQFRPEELSYLAGVYERLISGSLQHIDELTTVLTANKLRMSDDERIAAVDRLYAGMLEKQRFLHGFTSSNKLMALGRMKQQADAGTMKKIYGLDQ